MAFDAMITSSDSHNPVASMPLYAVLTDGHFEIIDPHDIEDLPCYTLTLSGRDELLDNHHTQEWLMDALATRGIDTAWMDEVCND